MKISAKAEYACLAMIELARRGSEQVPVRVREIAEEHGIPERYLVQILLQLKGAGLVYSARGSGGGYRLSRPADQISLYEVLVAIDGPGEPSRESQEPAAQALANVWENICAAKRAVLEKTTIAQLAASGASGRDWVI
ncbi:MAG: Rrf2 family transcriptional regulator [Planctomycetaceae bacterium]|nr:Rrf2 family transcriptional regulator [Planctomycetaceae bacterium]